MKITNAAKSLIVCLVLTTASPSMANTSAEIPPTKEVAESRAVELQNRLTEIEGMDKRTLSRSEKKVLRREVREIKKELAAISGGVYLSIGAIILIALLLILLL